MGKYITEINQLYEGLGGLFGGLDSYPHIKKAVTDAKITLAMYYSDPDGMLAVDASTGDIKFYTDSYPPDFKPAVNLRLKAATAHLYWLGKVNFMLAMQKGEIKAEGNLGLVLKLVPVLGPLFKAYAEVLKQKGMGHLVV